MRSPWRGSANCRSCRPTATLRGRPSASRSELSEEARQLLQHLATLVPDIEQKLLHALIHTETYGLWDRMKLPPGLYAAETADGGKVLQRQEDSQTVCIAPDASCDIL